MENFGLNPNVRGKFPYLDEFGVVRYQMYKPEIRKSIYIPVATFVTSYARKKTIETSQAIKDFSIKKYGIDKYVYSDTDSIHCLFDNDDDLKNIIDIDDYKLGAWKLESKFKRGKFLRQKCYIEENFEDKIKVTIAGMPEKMHRLINFNNFETGFTTENLIETEYKKLTYKHVKGGVMLVTTDFTIK